MRGIHHKIEIGRAGNENHGVIVENSDFLPMTPNNKPRPFLALAVFGAANVDIAASARIALAPGDSMPGSVCSTAGGVGRNMAENLARLQYKTCLVSAVGSDVHGEFLLNHTRRAGVDTSACSVFPGSSTGLYLSLNQPDGALLAAVNDMAVIDLLTPSEIARHAAVFASASAWVVDCNLSEASIAWLMHNKAGKRVFVDGVSSSKCLRVAPHLECIDTLKINRLEATALTGLPVRDTAQALAAAHRLCARGVENAVVSLGRGGVAWCQRSSSACGHTPALAVAVVNSNGAGDALTAGLVHGALAGWPLAQSVRFANACAALTLTSSSANHPDFSVAPILQLLEVN